MKEKRSRRRWLPAVLSVALAVALLEAILLIVASLSPTADVLLSSPRWGNAARAEADALLGRRPSPAFLGHDERGFRNPEAYRSAAVIAFGDSQTYGTSVAAFEAWPRRLEEIHGTSVYAMALGGYSPVQGLLLWDEAKALSPSVVVQAVYTGNDLPEAFMFVHEGAGPRELGSQDPDVLATFDDPRVERLREKVDRSNREWDARRETLLSPTRRIVRSRIWGLVRRLQIEVRESFRDPDAGWRRIRRLGEDESTWVAWENGDFRTVITPEIRLEAVDRSHPANAEGARIVREALAQLSVKVTASEARFVVVLIPTKERVFELWLGATQNPTLRLLLQEEAAYVEELQSFLLEQGIECVDTLYELRAALKRGEQPYYSNEDGHPNAVGQEAIARAVAAQHASLATLDAAVITPR